MGKLAVLALVLALVNVKALPFVWTVRFWQHVFWNFVVKRRQLRKSVFEQRRLNTYVPMLEIDLNMHKSNSTYFSDLDIARTDLMSHIFKDFYLGHRKETGRFPYTALGTVAASFKRELTVFQRYQVVSKIAGWDDKWVFVVSRFQDTKGIFLALAVSVYVFKNGRKTVPPEVALGNISEEDRAAGRAGGKELSHFLNIQGLDAYFDKVIKAEQ